MRTFSCSCPTHPTLFFESTFCEVCGKLVGFSDSAHSILAFEAIPDSSLFHPIGNSKLLYRQCQNYALHQVCNAMIEIDTALPAEQQPELCSACHYNQTIPDLSVPEHLPLWAKMEAAKRRTLFTLKQLRLPLPDKHQDPENGLCFHFKADKTAADHFLTAIANVEPVMTGHNQGHITINLAEADDVARASVKSSLGEHYRTLLGHFRHEIGHYYWDRLIAPKQEQLQSFRELFGDEQQDYPAALEQHYRDGAPGNWQENFISAYAAAHPWEDWAETWAHYLHMVDTLETAQSFGLQVNSGNKLLHTNIKLPQQEGAVGSAGYHNYYSDRLTSIDTILHTWMDFSVILNSLNRSMGLADAYPFVLYPEITRKFRFVHQLIQAARQS